MTEHSTTIGMDISDRYSHLYVLDNDSGEECEVARVPTTPAALERWFGCRAPALVVLEVLEVGCHAGWISRLLPDIGHDVLVADPRKARALMGKEKKDDKFDAEMLARVGRMDPKLLKPVKLRSEGTQCALVTIRSRDSLVSARTKLVNHVRGTVKTTGQRLRKCSTESFHRLCIPEPLEDALAPMMRAVEKLTEEIKSLDREIERMSEEDYPVAEQLQQINGVGPITALAFVLIIENAARFKKSRTVGAYLGLCRRRWQSGDDDPELPITKAGDALLRRLLIQCAHYQLGPHGKDSDLRRWGLQYAARGGKAAKKRAVVAVARRLAVIMHRLWVSDASYDPLYNSKRTNVAEEESC